MKKINPILGAKNAGTLYVHYSKVSSLKDIQKNGKVYTLDDTNRTILHRLKIEKRLFRLAWEKRLGLIQQTIGFLTETVEKGILNQLPPAVYEILPSDAISIVILFSIIFIKYITHYSKFTVMIQYHQKKNH